MSRRFASLLGCIIGIACAGPAFADDTEIFVDQAAQGGVRPNVLFIFDTSGSMNGLVRIPKGPYDPQRTYTGRCRAGFIYFREGAGDPPGCEPSRELVETTNLCRDAEVALDGIAGFWTGRIAQWDAGDAEWGALDPFNTGAPLECEADAGLHGENDSSSRRWARNDDDANRWTADPDHPDVVDWSDLESYGVYSANYLNWFLLPAQEQELSRLQIVQSVATSIASSISDVNLGLMRFSNTPGANGDRAEGGMVTHAIAHLGSERQRVIEGINSFTASGLTPLSETLFEAGQYFAGRPVVYGSNSRISESQPFPSVPESRRPDDPASYQSPITAQCQKNYIVLLTDGEPTDDNSADERITGLPDFSRLVGSGCAEDGNGRCLDEMAEYLFEKDFSTELEGTQNVVTYTIGFGPEVAGSGRLARVAQRGGGQSFSASNVTDLTAALQNIFGEIVQTSSTFTAPAVAVNAFSRTQTLNEIYLSVFQPRGSLRWPGNLKKYGLSSGRIVDTAGADAVDPATGFLKRDARSFWSTITDGDRVEVGGAASRLPDPDQRKLYTYLETRADSDLTAAVNALDAGNAALTDALLGTGTNPTRDELLRWARGYDVLDRDADGNRNEPTRSMGDPLHARPAVVPYGTGDTDAAADIVVYIPTNDGYLHAIDGRTGRELWAFVPPELLRRLDALYRDPGVIDRTYGLDGDIRVLRFDADGNATVDAAAGDRVWLFFGMRRGGRFYYALDVTDRARPRLLWKLGPDDLPGIGETWSTPTLARVRVSGAQQNGENIVAIFGGGYDGGQESFRYSTDDSGHRVFMVDAATGRRLWYAGGPEGDGTPDLSLPNMTHSIPSRIVVTDIDGDGFADRMYAADMGGRVWRFDIFGGRSPSELVTGGVIAELGATLDGTPDIEDTRRFYNAPDVALIQRRGAEPYYNLAIGSGYRGHPLHVDTRDRFYSLRDKLPFAKLTQSQYDSFDPITEADLADITDTLGTSSRPRTPNGWKLELRIGGGGWVGEKVLAESVTVNGVILFPTYEPVPPAARNPCVPATGINRVYALRADTGAPGIDFNDDGNLTVADAFTRLPLTGIAGEVSVIFESDPSRIARDGEVVPPPPDANRRDSLGRRAICTVGGVLVLNKCVSPPDVVRTFWERTAGNALD